MFRGSRPVGTVSGPDEDDRDDGSGERATTSRGSARGTDPSAGAPGRRPPAAVYEARIEELEATVAGLEAELERRADEHDAVVERYEQLLSDERGSGHGRPRRGDGRGASPGLAERVRSLFE